MDKDAFKGHCMRRKARFLEGTLILITFASPCCENSKLSPIRYKRTGCRAQDTIVEFKEPILLAVNESFLVCLEASTLGRTIQVFCFEEDIEMPEGQSTGLWD